MIYFSENLKLLRLKKGLSQLDLATVLEINRSKLNSYERGVQPPFETQLAIADFFNITLDGLIRHDLSKLSTFKLTQILRGSEADITGKTLRLLTVTVDSNNSENIELVSVKAHAGYTQGYADPDFLGQLPKFSMPFLPKNKTYRCFQIKGDSMPPVIEGSWVTASYLQDWQDLKDGENYIVVTLDNGIVFKRVYKQLQDRRLTLVSTNSEYAPYQVELKQVSEIWKFETWNGFEM